MIKKRTLLLQSLHQEQLSERYKPQFKSDGPEPMRGQAMPFIAGELGDKAGVDLEDVLAESAAQGSLRESIAGRAVS
jgi:hypothetical protein